MLNRFVYIYEATVIKKLSSVKIAVFVLHWDLFIVNVLMYVFISLNSPQGQTDRHTDR